MNANNQQKTRIFVVGNEKGGVGKTTYCIHLITALLDYGYKVSSIDIDSRQSSLTSYLKNRENYNLNNPDKVVLMPTHFHIKDTNNNNINDNKEVSENTSIEKFSTVMNKAKSNSDYVIIDTPGNYTCLSRIAHSYADTVITPINDSFIDLDVIAKMSNGSFDMSKPSIYSEMLWEQRMARVSRDNGSIDWVLLRNRLSNIHATNKENMSDALEKLSKRIAFRTIPGFSERVIFRELFPIGLTLVDLTYANFDKKLNMSHIAARQELRHFLAALNISSVT